MHVPCFGVSYCDNTLGRERSPNTPAQRRKWEKEKEPIGKREKKGFKRKAAVVIDESAFSWSFQKRIHVNRRQRWVFVFHWPSSFLHNSTNVRKAVKKGEENAFSYLFNTFLNETSSFQLLTTIQFVVGPLHFWALSI